MLISEISHHNLGPGFTSPERSNRVEPMSKYKICIIALTISLLLAIPGVALSTVVRLQTTLGTIDVELFDEGAPQTVQNFLNYVNRGVYNSSFFHRSVKDFVIQGGGFSWSSDTSTVSAIPKDDPVNNEFSLDRPNLHGTIAMARTSDLNSATSQWFFNLKDNWELDNPGNGYCVFGQVKENGLAVIDAISALQIVNAGGVFERLPLVSLPPQGEPVKGENLVLVTSAKVLPTMTASDSDRVFNYLEGTYQQYASPSSQPSRNGYGYYFRYYPATKTYVGTANGRLYYSGPLYGDEIKDLGSLSFWLNTAIAAGY